MQHCWTIDFFTLIFYLFSSTPKQKQIRTPFSKITLLFFHSSFQNILPYRNTRHLLNFLRFLRNVDVHVPPHCSATILWRVLCCVPETPHGTVQALQSDPTKSLVGNQLVHCHNTAVFRARQGILPLHKTKGILPFLICFLILVVRTKLRCTHSRKTKNWLDSLALDICDGDVFAKCHWNEQRSAKPLEL